MTKIYAKGNVIQHERISRGMTMGALGKAVGVSCDIISRIERKVAGTRPATAMRICEFLDRQFDELFNVRNDV
jgi:transcriptional regulator with XRE-family HTH domain